MPKMTLRAARVNAGFRQVEAAERFGVNKDTLSKFEKDSTNIPRLFFTKIEDVYGVPVNDIFFGVESEFFRKFRKEKV